jgi:DNA uptake protein ComE-like DNA-binding protein
MPLATLIAEMLKSGKVTVSTNNVEALEITAANKKININAVNKEFLKETLAATREENSGGIRGSIRGRVGQIKSARSSLGMLKDVAEELSEAGITVTLSYKGDLVVTMGSQASPKLSSIATGTKAIEINSLRKLVEMGI